MIRSGAAGIVCVAVGSFAICFGVMAAAVEGAWLAAAVIGIAGAVALGVGAILAFRADSGVMQGRLERGSRRVERFGEIAGRGLAAGQGGWNIDRRQRGDRADDDSPADDSK